MPLPKKGGNKTRPTSGQGKSNKNLDAVDVMKIAINSGFSLMDSVKSPVTGEELPSAVIATAVAYSENMSFDPTATHQNTDGSIDTGLWMINSVHQKSNPQWTVPYLMNTNNNARAALAVSGGGKNWSPWYAPNDRPSDYKVGLVMAKRAAAQIISGFDPDRLGVVEDITNIKAIGDIVGSLFGVTARAFAGWTIDVAKWIGKETYANVIHPVWGHTQRASIYYYKNVLSGRAGSGYYYSYAGMVTLLFWTFGYAILWQDADEIRSRATDKTRTALGRSIVLGQAAAKGRKLYAPQQAKKETPKKSKPKISSAPIDVMRTAKVQRRRTVKVDFDTTETTEETPDNVVNLPQKDKDADNGKEAVNES